MDWLSKVLWMGFLSSTAFATVPLQIRTGDAGSGEIFLACSFDGHADDCKIDTGGSAPFIKYDGFSQTYPSVGKVSFESATGTPRTCDLIQIARFEFAGLTLGDQTFIRCDSPPNDFSTVGINSFRSHAV